MLAPQSCSGAVLRGQGDHSRAAFEFNEAEESGLARKRPLFHLRLVGKRLVYRNYGYGEWRSGIVRQEE